MKQIFNPQWNRIPRKTKKRHPELFRHLLEEIRSDELQNLGYEYIMIRDFFKEYKGPMDFNSVSKVYENWDKENDRYYYPEEYS